MKRKQFIRNLLIGIGGISLTKNLKAESTYDKLKVGTQLDQVGFNHLPLPKSKQTMKTILHKADSRGYADHGWLKTSHTFSFASYYNPERMHFGVLRVLNDDYITGGTGFGTHPHDNMEIVSIPLEGELEHKDSMGNVARIKEGEVQVMSAGTGIQHSEYNRNRNQDCRFLQIWVFPRQKNVTPRYDQIQLANLNAKNELAQILSPSPDDDGVWIHQDAWFHMGTFDAGKSTSYQVKRSGNGVYAFLLEGEATIAGQKLEKRDGLGIWDTDQFNIEFSKDAKLLLMDVPMG